MKAFLQHDENGLYYRDDGWVSNVADAKAFSTEADAERHRRIQNVMPTHTIRRIDPVLIARFQSRAPGMYQAGE